jgi:outer membrane protein
MNKKLVLTTETRRTRRYTEGNLKNICTTPCSSLVKVARQIKKFLLCIIIIALSVTTVFSRDVYVLSLDSAIALAQERNFRIRMLHERVDESNYRLKAAVSKLRTKVNFNATLPNYEETFEQISDSSGIRFFPIKQRELYGNFEISQPLITDGRVYLNTGAYNSDDIINSTRIGKLTTGIGFEQPLQAFYIYNSIRSNYKQAKLNSELVQKQFVREGLDMVYNLSQAFYNVIEAQQTMAITLEDLTRQRAADSLAKRKYEAGLIREVEALQMEIDLGEAVNSYDIAKTNFIKQSNYLKQELGLALSDSVVAVCNLEYDKILIDPEKAVEYGLKNRSEITENEINVKLSEIKIKQQRAEGLPKGTISGYYNFIGMNKYPLSTYYSSVFNSTFDNMNKRPANSGIMFTVSIPIIDWGENRSLVRAEKANLNQLKLNLDYTLITIEREIRNNVNDLQGSLRRLLLLEKNVKLAEKSIEISYLRFSNGDIDAEALALDRSRYNKAQLSYLNAYIGYKMLLLDLNRKTFFDFEKNRPVF